MRRGEDGLFVAFSLPVPADLPIGEAHEISDGAERDMKRRPGGGYVVIHVEPREG